MRKRLTIAFCLTALFVVIYFNWPRQELSTTPTFDELVETPAQIPEASPTDVQLEEEITPVTSESEYNDELNLADQDGQYSRA